MAANGLASIPRFLSRAPETPAARAHATRSAAPGNCSRLAGHRHEALSVAPGKRQVQRPGRRRGPVNKRQLPQRSGDKFADLRASSPYPSSDICPRPGNEAGCRQAVISIRQIPQTHFAFMATASSPTFHRADLVGANLARADLGKCGFDGARIIKCMFGRANPEDPHRS